jgi:hypothetical protein
MDRRTTCMCQPPLYAPTIILNVVQRASLVLHVLFLSQFYTSSPFAFPCSFGNPSLVLTTNMAAHVYRNTRLGLYRDHTTATSAWQQAVGWSSTMVTDRSEAAHIVFDKSTTTPEHSTQSSDVSSHEEPKLTVTGCCPHLVEIATDSRA